MILLNREQFQEETIPPDSTPRYHGLALWGLLGVIATGLVIGGVAVWLLYQIQRQTLDHKFQYEIDLQVLALESELQRLMNITKQITSRLAFFSLRVFTPSNWPVCRHSGSS